mgnify:CR=1 FL=1
MNIKKLFLCMGAILTLSLVTMCVTTVNDNAGKEETVICRGQEAHTSGPMVKVGQQAPDFRATMRICRMSVCRLSRGNGSS